MPVRFSKSPLVSARLVAVALLPALLLTELPTARAQDAAPQQDIAAPVPAPDATGPVARKPRRRRPVVAKADPAEAPSELAGRYAVMRDKRDTGCMVTLDAARIKGGERAQLAPGCRDQGIVVFDPTAWQVVKGELVLTARAGHKAHLDKDKFGVWQKDPKDGGKPLGLKKL